MFVSVIVKKNHVLQSVKFMISSTSRTHVPYFLRPGTSVQMFYCKGKYLSVMPVTKATG